MTSDRGRMGIDALVGTKRGFDGEVLAALRDLGYVIETDWRPNRVELVGPGPGLG
jgi:hypothetical protein